MKIYIEKLHEIDIYDLLRDRARFSRKHTIVDDPANADLIIVCGNFGSNPALLLENSIYLSHMEKCAAYSEHDHFVPLIPGVYCSSRKSLHSEVGRIFSFSYISRTGNFTNPFVQHRPDATKKYFFTFQGGSTCILRKRLYRLKFNRPDVLIENTSSYGHWEPVAPADHLERQQRFGETISASRFVLCPRGAGSSSIRFFEVLAAGVAPVLIADGFVLPPGIEWDSFLIRVKERDIAKLPQILEPLLPSAEERGRKAREVHLANFADEVVFDRIADLCAQSLQHSGPPEAWFRAQQKKILAAETRRHARYAFAKKTALTLMRILHIKNPYEMNER